MMTHKAPIAQHLAFLCIFFISRDFEKLHGNHLGAAQRAARWSPLHLCLFSSNWWMLKKSFSPPHHRREQRFPLWEGVVGLGSSGGGNFIFCLPSKFKHMSDTCFGTFKLSEQGPLPRCVPSHWPGRRGRRQKYSRHQSLWSPWGCSSGWVVLVVVVAFSQHFRKFVNSFLPIWYLKKSKKDELWKWQTWNPRWRKAEEPQKSWQNRRRLSEPPWIGPHNIKQLI